MQLFLRYNKRQDFISMAAAFLCLIHCVALPLFFSTLALWGIEVLENIWLELATLAISFFIGGMAIWRGYTTHHHKRQVIIYFSVGMLLMVGGNFVGGELFEIISKIAGAAAMVIAHTINWRRSHLSMEAKHMHDKV